jgi:ferredoxin--NADP+ reductase
MIVEDEDFNYDDASRAAIESNKQVLVIDRVFTQWRQRTTGAASRRLHLHFFARPDAVLGTGAVSGFRWERTEPDGEGGVRGTGEFREIPVQAVYRAVGYFGSPLDGIPFDEKLGIIPNREGQVLAPATGGPSTGSGTGGTSGASTGSGTAGGEHVMPGVYATGWIKRGPVGLIGHTKSDAMETVRHLVRNQADWWSPESPSEESVVELLESRGIEYTNLHGWHNLDAFEQALGAPHGRVRIKVVPREEMVKASNSA